MLKKPISLLLALVFGAVLIGGCTTPSGNTDDGGRAMPRLSPWWEEASK